MIFVAVLFICLFFNEGESLEASYNQSNATERYSKVRYLPAQQDKETRTNRPLFEWNSVTLGTTATTPAVPKRFQEDFSLKNVTKYLENNNKIRNENKKANKMLNIIKKPKKDKRKKKRRYKKKNRKKLNKKKYIFLDGSGFKNTNNTSQLILENFTSLQDLIVKLNNNPEILPKDLVPGRNKPNKLKNRYLNSTSLHAVNVSATVNNEMKILLEINKTKPKSSKNEFSFYDPSFMMDAIALAVTESVNFKESNKIKPSVPTNEVIKPSFKELFKSLANVSPACMNNNGGCAHFCTGEELPVCSCLEGFMLASDGKACVDIDECTNNNGGCEKTCQNIVGSYYCDCPSGMRISDDLKTCEDVNECLLRNGHGPCQDVCTNTFGSYFCNCSNLNGTRLANDKHACEDVNECTEGKSGCSHGCINTHGRAFCTCPEGLELGLNWKTCYDINECDNNEIRKGCQYGCVNTIGSYHCKKFLESIQNDHVQLIPKIVSCPPLFPPKHGFYHCSRKKAASGLKTRNGRLRVTNRPGTYCELVCPNGFKNVGDFRLLCGTNGGWVGAKYGKCTLLSGRKFDLHSNYIGVTWALPKPKINCPGPIKIYLKPDQQWISLQLTPPKTNVDWKYVETDPFWAKTLRVNFTKGHHWITFKATDPRSNLSSKCIIYVVVKKLKI